MDGVHALRDRAGADLVHLIVDADKASGSMAGGGAFGLTVHSALWTFAHEVGHNAPRWADALPPAGSPPIRAAHVTELRAAVLALE